MIQLTYPAPRRVSIPTRRECGTQLFVTHPYTVLDVEATKSYGGYFQAGCHDFADEKARDAALGKDKKEKKQLDTIPQRKVPRWIDALTPAQKELLLQGLEKE